MLLYVLHCFLSTVLLIIWDNGTQGLENIMALCTAIYSLASCKSQKGLRKKFQNSHPVILSSSLLSFAHLVSSQPWSLTRTDKCCRVAEPQDRCCASPAAGSLCAQGWGWASRDGTSPISRLTPSPPSSPHHRPCGSAGSGAGCLGGEWEALGHGSFGYSESFLVPLVHRLSLVSHSCLCLAGSFGLQIHLHFELMSVFWIYTWENKVVWKRQNSAQCCLHFSQEKDPIFFSDGLLAQQLLWRNNYVKFSLSN